MAMRGKPLGTTDGIYFIQADIDDAWSRYLEHEEAARNLRERQAESNGRTRGALAAQATRHERQAADERERYMRLVARIGCWGYVRMSLVAPDADWFNEVKAA